MSDQYWASITIGGEIKEEDLLDFVHALRHEFGNIDEGEVTDSASAVKWIEDQIKKWNGHLYQDDVEASYGMFDGLETWCQDHGVSYDRQSDSYGDYEGETAWWRPGMTEPESMVILNDGHPVLRKERLTEVLKIIRETTLDNVALRINSDDEDEEFIVRCVLEEGKTDPLALLEKWIDHTYPEPPSLPELKIIRG